jgi:hypothetical protein
MGDVLDLAERFWRGEIPRRDLWRPSGTHEELVPGLGLLPYLGQCQRYDEPDYVIRNIWRLHGGWWDGRPAHLKLAREEEIGLEGANLAGGIDMLLPRARALAAEGPLELASHLVD